MTTDMTDETKAALAAQGGITDDGDEAAKAAAAKAIEDAAAKAIEDGSVLPEITIDEAAAKKAADEEAAKKSAELNQTVSKTLEDAGYTDEMLAARLKQDGGISDEFVTELKGKVDPDFIDAHVGRLRAEYDLAKVKESGKLDEVNAKNKVIKDMNDHIYSTVGGEDKFNVLAKTLKDKLSADDLTALNIKFASGNKVLVNEAIKEAVTKYNNIRGMGGKLMSGDAGISTEAPEHLTKEEFRAVMRSEKYKTDPKYAEKIDADRLKTREADKAMYPPGQYYGYHPKKGRYTL